MKPARRPQRHDDDMIVIEVIDVIDDEAHVFDAGPSRAPAPARRSYPRWLAPTAAVVAVGAVAALLISPPWRTEPELRTFPVPSYPLVVELGPLSFAEPPGSVVGVRSADTLPSPSTVVGHLFAAPGATFDTRHWVLFQARPSSGGSSAPATTDAAFTLHGVEADFSSRRFRHSVTWGPLGGHRWRIDSNLLSETETMVFAEAVAVSRGAPACDYDFDLGGLQPVGSAAAFERAFALRQQLFGSRSADLAPDVSLVNHVRYDGEGAVQLASVAAPLDALSMAEFVFGSGRAAVVHGLPALVIDRQQVGTLVIWYEHGLLVTVAGQLPVDELLTLANSVGPANAT